MHYPQPPPILLIYKCFSIKFNSINFLINRTFCAFLHNFFSFNKTYHVVRTARVLFATFMSTTGRRVFSLLFSLYNNTIFLPHWLCYSYRNITYNMKHKNSYSQFLYFPSVIHIHGVLIPRSRLPLSCSYTATACWGSDVPYWWSMVSSDMPASPSRATTNWSSLYAIPYLQGTMASAEPSRYLERTGSARLRATSKNSR